ncbi:MAG: GNAT family N-acetyltransferase [Culicoidibacterales bacterium]
MVKTQIRFVEMQDIPTLLEIYAPYVSETAITFEYHVPTVAEFSERVQRIAQVYPYLVYEVDGEVIGYAYASQQRERAAYQWNVELSVYIKQTKTGRGYGRMLTQAILELLERQNVRNVYSLVTVPNVKSENLHRALGFKKRCIFEKTGYKFSQWYDVAWFEKTLRTDEGAPEPLVLIKDIELKIRKPYERNAKTN